MEPSDKILARIKKLLALGSNNPNQAEAEIAMKRAHALLAEYNLSMSDLEKDRDDKYQRTDWILKQSGPWARTCAQHIATLYFCKYYYIHRHGRVDSHFLVGRNTNVQTARMIIEYVLQTINNEAITGGRVNGTPWRNSFRNAAAHIIRMRCKKMIEDSCRGETVVEGTNLPVLASLYEKEQKNAECHLESMGVKLKTRAVVTKTSDYFGAQAGKAAGERVNLRPTVGHTNSMALERKP